MTDAPHVPAAFINAIAEEGTKAEAIEWLQKTWNENCLLRSQLAKARDALEQIAQGGNVAHSELPHHYPKPRDELAAIAYRALQPGAPKCD